jgi:autotransporter-associated beta strand protein
LEKEMSMKTRLAGVAVAVLAVAGALWADEQTWNDDGPNDLWSTADANWAGGAVWANGNSALFSGGGETVDVSGAISVANITFQANGYTVADTDANGTLTVMGAPSVIAVVNAGGTGTVSEAISGSGGITKAGGGVLNLTATNAYTGTTTVESGILRLAPGILQGLGATGTGNDTVVADGATIDFNGCYKDSTTAEKFAIAGSGVDGVGALINTGAGHVNKNLGWVTLSDDATLGGSGRIDFSGLTGNGKTLTKIGTHQLCMRSLSNAEIVVNEGNFTLLADANALGGTTWGDTTLNGGTIYGYHNLSVPERIIVNGGTLSEGGPGGNTFTFTGPITLNSNLTVNSGSGFAVDLTGYLDGAGGFTQAGAGWCTVTCDTNSYTGPTTINSGCPLHVGKTNVYAGVLGSGVVTNHGTLYGYSSRFTSGTLVNDGTLRAYHSMTIDTPVILNGGTVVQGDVSNVFTLAGSVTLNNNTTFSSSANCGVELSGTLDGPGGFTQAGDGWVIVSGNANTYSGPTTINSGKSVWLGRPGIPQGTFGSGPVTTWGNLYFDRSGAYSVSNAFFGSGTPRIRYGGAMALCASASTVSVFRVIDGTLTLTNGASLAVTTDFTLADRQSASYTNTVLNFSVTAIVNIVEGTMLRARDIIIGNQDTVPIGILHGTINQYGGWVSTYGNTAESNGMRVGHYPLGLGTYNMRGGWLTIDNGWDLCIATDGTGWVHQTGGEIYASRVMLNERDGNRGFGRLTVEGGVLNIGLTNGILNVVANGIMADSGAPYLVEYGGAGGIVRAVTNFVSALNATLFGTNADAITFDTQAWGIDLSGTLSGAGGLNKAGTGTLSLSGANTYSGPTRILAGALKPASAGALPAGGEVLFRIAADDSGGRLVSEGDLSLAGVVVGVDNPEDLDKAKSYTVATYVGTLAVTSESDVLPDPWFVYYDWPNKRVQIKAAVGTLIRLR